MKELPPTTPHEWFYESRKVLGIRTLMDLYGRSQTQIYRYARDPRAKERGIENDAENSPLQALLDHCQELINAGRIDLARAARDMLNRLIGDESSPRGEVIPDKDTLYAELLDTLPALVRFQQAIVEGEHPDVTEYLCREAKCEIEEDQVAHCKEYLVSVGKMKETK